MTRATSEALEALTAHLPISATISTITEKEGETRRVRILCVDSHLNIRDVTGIAATVLSHRLDSKGRLIFRGHGTNAGDHIVASLALALYGFTAALKNHTV